MTSDLPHHERVIHLQFHAMEEADLLATCQMFNLGAPRGGAAAVAGGLVNRLWRLTTESGVFAVKEMNRDFGDAGYVAWHDRAFTLEQAAFAAGIPMPRPVPVAATGRCLGELPGDADRPITVRVHEWADGVKLENNIEYGADVAVAAASILARIHNLQTASDVTATESLRVFGDEHWRETAERADDIRADWAAQFSSLLPVLAELEAYLLAAHDDSTPLLLSHRDADMKNHMRTPGGALILVDWDGAGPVNPRHDFANHALVWAGVHRGDPNPAIASAYVDAFRAESSVTDAFRSTDLAELVSIRLGWFNFNVRRALGERARDDSDRDAGVQVIRRNVDQLPRFARSLSDWLSLLIDI